MTGTPPSGHYWRLVVGARVLAVVVLAVPILVGGERTTTVALVALAAVWLASTVATSLNLPGHLIHAMDASMVGAVVGLSLDAGPAGLALLAALAVPPFTAGLHRGVGGAGLAVSTEVLLLFVVHDDPTSAFATELSTWTLTAVGLGFIASYLHSSVLNPRSDPLAPYHEAQVLIRELIDLSGDLRSGLDPVTLASRIAVEVRNVLPVRAVAIYVPRGDQLTPLVTGSVSSRVDPSLLQPLAEHAWRTGTTQIDTQRFAFTLRNEVGAVAVVAGMLPAGTDAAALDLEGRLESLVVELDGPAVQLDTAMQFTRLRDAATARERRRLARDLHDGVAQDIASLGYLVDALAAAPASPGQAEGLRRLRERITAVVTQVRLSVQTLRHEVDASESLGAAVSGVARHLSESSDIPIRVTVNERTTRLLPEVEAELLRIAQEAMTNAVRHSGATIIDVSCRVAAPSAEITVRDDGQGLGSGRPDSYGLAIMRERADLIDADFTIEAHEPHGTIVTVRVPSRHPSVPQTASDRSDRVSA